MNLLLDPARLAALENLRILDTPVDRHFFQVFGQSDRSLDRAHGGLGLGLPLSRRLAEWHGGSLHARSEGLGKGSECLLTLRRATPIAESRKQEIEEEPAAVLDITSLMTASIRRKPWQSTSGWRATRCAPLTVRMTCLHRCKPQAVFTMT